MKKRGGEFYYKIAALDPQSGLVLSEMTAKPSKRGIVLAFPLGQARVGEGHEGAGIFTTMVAHAMKVAHEKGMSVASRPVLNAGMREALLKFGWTVTRVRGFGKFTFMQARHGNMDRGHILEMLLKTEGFKQPGEIPVDG